MASKARQIVEAVVARVQTVNGSAPYSYDLSGDATRIGQARSEVATYPVAWVAPAAEVSEAGTALVRVRSTLDLDIEIRVAPDAQTPSERVLAALDVAAEVRAALEGDRDLGGLAREVLVRSGVADGDELGMGMVGIAYLIVTVQYERMQGGI